jgi:hypothetical protein
MCLVLCLFILLIKNVLILLFDSFVIEKIISRTWRIFVLLIKFDILLSLLSQKDTIQFEVRNTTYTPVLYSGFENSRGRVHKAFAQFLVGWYIRVVKMLLGGDTFFGFYFICINKFCKRFGKRVHLKSPSTPSTPSKQAFSNS